MSNLKRIRIGTDVHMTVRVMESGIPVDWNNAEVIALAAMDKKGNPYSAGRFSKGSFAKCEVTPMYSDRTRLDVLFPAESQLAMKVTGDSDFHLIVSVKHDGATSSYDAPAFTLVPSSSCLKGESHDPEETIDLDLQLEEITSSEVKRMLEEATWMLANVSGAEAEREISESQRESNEAVRIANENARKAAEIARASAENQRVTTFNTNETQRQDTFDAKEAVRNRQEAEREFNEGVRQSNEATRIANEEERKTNESSRQSAFESGESSRQSTFNTNETNRGNEFNTLKEQMNAAKTGAETAITNANNAANNANDKAALAEAAATNAETKTQEALDKVDQAQVIVNAEKLTELKNKVNTLGIYVTPEMYGAKGDGVTDDKIAVQNAIDSRMPVIFEHGKTYFVSSGLTLRDGTVIYGNKSTLLFPTSFQYYIYNLTLREVSNVVIQDVCFQSVQDATARDVQNFSRTASGYSNRCDIDIIGCTNVTISGCESKGASGSIKISGDTQQLMSYNIRVINCTFDAFTPIYVSNCESLIVDGCILNCSNGNSLYDHGIYGAGKVYEHIVANCKVTNCQGIAFQYIMSGTSTPSTQRVVISNCYLIQNKRSFAINGEDSTLQVTNCFIKTTAGLDNDSGDMIIQDGGKLFVSDTLIDTTNQLVASSTGVFCEITNCDIKCNSISNNALPKKLVLKDSRITSISTSISTLYSNKTAEEIIIKNNEITVSKTESFSIRQANCKVIFNDNIVNATLSVSLLWYNSTSGPTYFVAKRNIISTLIRTPFHSSVPTQYIADNDYVE